MAYYDTNLEIDSGYVLYSRPVYITGSHDGLYNSPILEFTCYESSTLSAPAEELAMCSTDLHCCHGDA